MAVVIYPDIYYDKSVDKGKNHEKNRKDRTVF